MGDARERLDSGAEEAARTLVELLKSDSPSVALKSAELILKSAGLLKEPGEAAGLERWREVLVACLRRKR